jgi:hypothetical protein
MKRTGSPSPNGRNGRDAGGRFAKGNAGGPGNPFSRRAAELRTALYEAVTPDDLRAIVKKLVKHAKAGDVTAAREVLNRLLGKPEPVDLLERIEALEQRLTKEDNL